MSDTALSFAEERALTQYVRRTWSKDDGLPSNSIEDIAQTPDGYIWLATGQGLVRFDGVQFRVFNSGNTKEMKSDGVVELVLARNRVLWAGTTRGNIYRSANSELASLPRNQGIPAVPVKSLVAEDDGSLWIGTVGGVTVVRPEVITKNDIPPPVWIEGVAVDGVEVPLHQAGRIDPRARRIEFSYTAPTFRAPEKVRFKCRLDGLDTDWVDVRGVRQFSYTNLGPGEYEFHVRACNNNGIWNEKGARWSFTVLPHFYETTWFYFLCCLAAFGAALLVHRIYALRLRARNAVLIERTRIARDIHDILGQSLTGLALQLEASEGKLFTQPLEAHGHVSRARRLVAECLVESRRAIDALRAGPLETGSFHDPLRIMAESFVVGTHIQLDVNVTGRPRPLPRDVENSLLRICQEAMTNAVRHSQGRHLTGRTRYARRHLLVVVADDGVGVDSSHVPGGRRGFGIEGMRERARAHGWSFRRTSAPARGTTVSVEAHLPRLSIARAGTGDDGR